MFSLDVKPSFSNRAETELKYKHRHYRKFSICILSYTDRWYLVPFSNNISCDGRNKVCVCYGYRITNCKVHHSMCVLCNERNTQQENSCTKQAFRKRRPVTATLGRAVEVSQ